MTHYRKFFNFHQKKYWYQLRKDQESCFFSCLLFGFFFYTCQITNIMEFEQREIQLKLVSTTPKLTV